MTKSPIRAYNTYDVAGRLYETFARCEMITLPGVVRGKTIELSEVPDIAEGQQVLVRLTVVPESTPDEADQTDSRFNGLLKTEGALADDNEWDGIMSEVHQTRKLERTSEFGGR